MRTLSMLLSLLPNHTWALYVGTKLPPWVTKFGFRWELTTSPRRPLMGSRLYPSQTISRRGCVSLG
ncbi:hypothetical protein LINPERHAP1_LOCUS22606 [Linum perenne]